MSLRRTASSFSLRTVGLPENQFKGMGIAIGDMRISVGLEDVDDLIQDLEQAFG